jgi:RHS repeat-associated protein
VTDPLGNVTSYTYGAGSTGNPQLASDLLTITSPNAQPGGPDAGKATVNVYDSSARVTSQTDPTGYQTTFNHCASAAAGNCMDPATGTGLVTVHDPDGNSTVYSYQQGTLAATSVFTGSTLTSETDEQPNTASGTLLDGSSTDGNGNTTTSTYDAAGNITQENAPAASGTATTTSGYATGAAATADLANCASTAEASAACQADSPPAPVAPGGTISPPSAAPPLGTTYTLYDTDGNALYSTTGVYQPGASSASYSRTTYQLFKNNTVTLGGTAVSCTATPPSQSLPCAKVNADGVVTQLGYDWAGDLTSSATPDGNGSQAATTTYGYDSYGEQTSTTAPDGNVSGANAGNYTTILTDSGNAYIYTGGVAPAEQVNLATGSVTYLVTDSLGSVRGVVNSTGTLTATTSYDAWGNPEATGSLTVSTPYGYAGGYTDPTGLVYLINRYYDPAVGQFTSVDPDVSQTLTPYAYANDDPVLNSDPTGLSAYEPVCATSGGWRVKVCIEDAATWYNGDWNAVVAFQPVSGQNPKNSGQFDRHECLRRRLPPQD